MGEPKTVKSLLTGLVVEWNVNPVEHTSPFDSVVIQSGDRIIQIVSLPQFRLDSKTSLKVRVN